MEGLPRKLETFNVYGNTFSGRVLLMHLPVDLQDLNLRENRLKEAVVSVEDLPAGLDVSVKRQRRGKAKIVFLGTKEMADKQHKSRIS